MSGSFKKADAPIWTGGSPSSQGSSQPGQQRFLWSKFIWNPETHEFLGRTGLSWFKITVFYICFYAGLASFFLLSLKIAMVINVEDDRPKFTLDSSLITSNPGVGFRPMPNQDSNVESTLIWINSERESNSSFWTDALNGFLKDYEDSTEGEICSFEKPSTADKPCKVDVEKMLECNKTKDFGYTSGPGKVRPCVLIKLNRIYDWDPQPYETLEDLELARERDMPDHLVERIEKLIEKSGSNGGDEVAANELKTVWFSCEGENPADIESIGGPHHIKYFAPGYSQEFPGIPTYYFPYKNQPGFLSPFIFVQFSELQDNVLINIRCKAWAKNIVAEMVDRKGMVHFEFFID